MTTTPAAPPERTPQEITDAIARLAATPNGPAALDLLHRHQHLSTGESLAIAASWNLRGGGPAAPVAEKAANAVRGAVDPATWADFEAVSRHLRLDHRARLDEHHETLTSKVEPAAFWAAAVRLATPGGPPAAIALLEAMFTTPLHPNVDERRPTVARTLDWAAVPRLTPMTRPTTTSMGWRCPCSPRGTSSACTGGWPPKQTPHRGSCRGSGRAPATQVRCLR